MCAAAWLGRFALKSLLSSHFSSLLCAIAIFVQFLQLLDTRSRHRAPQTPLPEPRSDMQASTYYSIDVECVATGTDHNSRGVAQISLVVRTPMSAWLPRGAGAGLAGAHPDPPPPHHSHGMLTSCRTSMSRCC